ncbi:MAG: hypothetical protein MUF79_09410 [Burkholderiales bacterium]|nr:hypothetical protein [Burkholderiales bacterium]
MYSRENPSPRYRELTQLYRQMHAEGEQFLKIPPEQTFPGLSLPSQAGRIKRLVAATGATNILDYGSGKGMQYDLRGIKAEDGTVYDSIQDFWDVDFIQCYDPSFTPFSKLPTGRLPTGENAHCTIQPPEWWQALIRRVAAQFPGVAWEFWIQWREDAPGGPRLVETRLSSEDS